MSERDPPPLPSDPPPGEDRRKSLGLLKDITTSWSAEPPARKYSLNENANQYSTVDFAKTEPDPSRDDVDRSKTDTESKEVIHFTHKDPKPVETRVDRVKKDAEAGTSSMPPTPRTAMKMSCMEEEAIRERLRAMLLRQMAEILDSEGAGVKYSRESFRRVFLNKEVLSRLFQLFDQDRDSQINQEEWIEFLKERLTDEKQIDLAEQLESVAYVLCGDEHISLDKFCQIFQAKGIVDKLFRLVDLDSDGIVTPAEVMEFIANLTNPRPRSGFDKKNLEWLEQLFRQTVGNEKEIKKEDFKKICITKNPFFTDRAFEIFDKDSSGSISMQEFMDSMHQFAGKSPDDKIRFLFKVYDLDGDGLIQHQELQHVMKACMEENGMQFSEEQIDDLTMALFEDADVASRGAITYEALKNQLEKHGGLLENLSISIDRWLVPPKPKPPPSSIFGQLSHLKPYQLSRPYIRNNYVYLSFLVFLLAVNVGLFISRSIQYRKSSYFVILARACGQCLNFNCMFVLVLMLRHSITFLRTRGFSSFLPLDQHIYFHKLTGVFIFLYSVLHTIMHLLNFSLDVLHDPVINANNYTLPEWIFTTKPGLFGLIGGIANPTGVCLIIILIVMFICSQKFVRRGGCFEVFYWTHLLYVPFWVLLILHAPNFWKWFIIPGIIYLVERILRFSLMRSERGKTYISSGLLLPSRVTHLVIKRPPQFDFHPGDYVFVNIPTIAKYEWHPFTISSAPEQEGYMWLHVRGVGEWTNRLHTYFEKEQEKLHNIEEALPGQTKPPPNNGTSVAGPPPAIKKLQASISRKFSGRDLMGNARGKMVIFKKDQSGGYTNESFSSEDLHGSIESNMSVSDTSSNNDIVSLTGPPKRGPQNKNLHMLLMQSKTPLNKSLSMPDMDNRVKKRQRLIALREYMRSESEKSFDECQMRRARLQSLGLAYLSPQNKSLAQSFRYMRNKPTIIAFKTPSLESCEAKMSALSILGRQGSELMGSSSSESAAEEGRVVTKSPHTPINYPVGKPLENSDSKPMKNKSNPISVVTKVRRCFYFNVCVLFVFVHNLFLLNTRRYLFVLICVEQVSFEHLSA
uniref:NAD(P)H oxidase (H(2)O(2)-forming) n=1 Tax=Clastoptera arizonana TaxID=38151 RepID=A0A1B6DLA4_9HEMI